MSNNSKQTSLYIGFIIDVSSSMRRNWKNEEGKTLPRIEVVRDILNRHFQKLSLVKPSQGKVRAVEVFCLGMGFKQKMYWQDVRISYGKEEQLSTKQEERIDTGVVCDLIALAEIIPNERKLSKLETTINKKWHDYTQRILDHTSIDDEIYQQLQNYIQQAIYESAYQTLHRNLLYTIYSKLKGSSWATKNKTLLAIKERLARYVTSWEGRIDSLSVKASQIYFKGILKESKKIFEDNKAIYISFIEKKLREFVDTYSKTLLHLLTLGHPMDLVIDYFDEDKVMDLAKQIYQHLDKEVRHSITIAWTLNRGNLFITSKSLGASLNSKELKTLTEKCIQKYSWGIIEPFVKQTVKDIFKSSFEAHAKEMMSKWVGLASKREVSRTPRQIANLLPDSLTETIYSEECMFGSTPIHEAMNLASLRLLDKANARKEKVLVVISDGEFSTDSPIVTSRLLQQGKVTLVCCYLTSQDIMTSLTSSSSRFWPNGAKKMFDMASVFDPESSLIKDITAQGHRLPEGTKLFYQINQSELLGDVLDGLIYPGG